MYLPESLRCRFDIAGLDLSIPWDFMNLIPRYDKSSTFNTTHTLWGQIRQYCSRDLSYPSNALNAFLGILNHYHSETSKKWGYSRSYITGIPVVQSRDSVDVYLLWNHPYPAKRRPEFPSWSWVGWEGEVLHRRDAIKLNPPRHSEKPSVSERPWQIQMGEQGQSKTRLSKFVENRLAGLHEGLPPSLEPRRLWISGSVIPFDVPGILLASNSKSASCAITKRLEYQPLLTNWSSKTAT